MSDNSVEISPSEVINKLPEVVTGRGTFRFFYEIHGDEIDYNLIKPDTTHFFREFPARASDDSLSASFPAVDILNAVGISPGREDYQVFPCELVEKLADNNITLVLGDTGDVYDIGGEAVKLAVAGAIASRRFYNLRAVKTRKEPEGKKTIFNRREFLKMASATAAMVWLTQPILTGIGLLHVDQDKPEGRIMQRIDAIASHSHPETALVFFRNLVWARKLLKLKELDDNKSPMVYAQVGKGHGGVEDFIRLGDKYGPDLLSKLIASYPKPLLDCSVKRTGGLDQFCSLRLIKILQLEKAGERWALNCSDEFVVDSDLVKILADKRVEE